MAFNNQMAKIKVSELELDKYITDKGKVKISGVLDILKDETILSATILLGGLPRGIDLVLREENQKRSLKEIDVLKLLNE